MARRICLLALALPISAACGGFELWGITNSPYSNRTYGARLQNPPPVVLTPEAPSGHLNVQFRLLSSEPLQAGTVRGGTENGYFRLDRGSGGGSPRVRFSLEYYIPADGGLNETQRMFVTDGGTLRVYSKVDTVTDAEYPTPPTEVWELLKDCAGGSTFCATTIRFVWDVENFDGNERYDFVAQAAATVIVPESYAEKVHWNVVVMDDDGGFPNLPGG